MIDDARNHEREYIYIATGSAPPPQLKNSGVRKWLQLIYEMFRLSLNEMKLKD
jgi:hypothetical protein